MVETKDIKDTKSAITAAGGKSFFEQGEYGSKTNAFKQDTKGTDLLELIVKHPLVRACLKIRVSSIVKSDYKIVNAPRNSVKTIESLEYDVRFDILLQRIMWQLSKRNCYYGEIVKDESGRINQIRTIDGQFMEHELNEKGDIIGFWQVLNESIKLSADEALDTRKEISRARGDEELRQSLISNGAAVYFDVKDIFYIADNLLDSSGFAHAELLTLREALYNIDLIEKFITWSFESNQFRNVIRIPPNMSTADYQKYMQSLMDSMSNPTNFLLLRGNDIQHAQLRKIEGFEELLKLLDYYRTQVLSLLQITPIQVTLTGDSNRSSSDTQYRYVNYDDIRYKRKLLSDNFKYSLFPRIGLKGAELRWSPIDLKETKDLLEIANIMLSIGGVHEKVEEWLIDNGLNIDKGTIVKPEVTEDDNGQSEVKLDKNSDLHPSRKKQELQMEDLGRN